MGNAQVSKTAAKFITSNIFLLASHVPEKPLRPLTKICIFIKICQQNYRRTHSHTYAHTHAIRMQYACKRVLAEIEFVPDFDIIFIRPVLEHARELSPKYNFQLAVDLFGNEYSLVLVLTLVFTYSNSYCRQHSLQAPANFGNLLGFPCRGASNWR